MRDEQVFDTGFDGASGAAGVGMLDAEDSSSSGAPAPLWPGVSPTQLEGVPDERLEHELRSLAGHLAAATCAFLVMVGEYDARRAWTQWECLSCAHWLNWRCGVSLPAAREQVRVARALRDLPVLLAEFSRGALSYSKVRAITRVAHRGNEASLVELASHATAAQLDRMCTALRRCAPTELPDDELADAAARSRAMRSLSWHHDEHSGDLIGRFRIPAGVDAETFTTIIGRLAQLHQVEGTEPDPLECRRLDALLDAITSDDAAHDHDASLAVQPEIIVHHHQAPDPSPADTTRVEHARPSGHLEGLELLTELEHLWHTPWHTAAGTPLDSVTAAMLACDAGIRTVTIDTRRLQLDAEPHRRRPTRAQRRAVYTRDGRRCRFPGCNRRRRLHIHHIVHYEHGGPTIIENLITLCHFHHRAVHHRDWTLTGTADRPTWTHPRFGTVPESAPPQHGRAAELAEQHRQHGTDIALDGPGGRWLGDNIDWDCFFAIYTHPTLAPWTPPEDPTPPDPPSADPRAHDP